MNKIFTAIKIVAWSIVEAKWAIAGKESDSTMHMSLRRYY